MNYNDGYVHMEFYEQEEDLEKVADDFSEGDPLLKDTLLNLWENDIKTTSCCKGHENRPAYVSIVMSDKSKRLIQASCEYLYVQDGKLELDFIKANEDYNTFVVYMDTEQDKIDYLNYLNLILNQKNMEQESTSDISTYADYLFDFARKMNLNCRYAVEKDQMMFGYTQPGKIQLFSSDALKLDEIIAPLVETGRLPLGPFSCDGESLQKFISVLYPGSFTSENNVVK